MLKKIEEDIFGLNIKNNMPGIDSDTERKVIKSVNEILTILDNNELNLDVAKDTILLLGLSMTKYIDKLNKGEIDIDGNISPYGVKENSNRKEE